MASIRKKQLSKPVNGKPAFSWQVMWRDPDGKQRAKAFNRYSDAKSFADHVEVDKSRGAYVDPQAGRITVKDYAVGTWLANKRATKRPATATLYQGHLEQHILPTFGGKRLASECRQVIWPHCRHEFWPHR